MTKTKALIFDFDGLILETESPVYQAWQEVYQAHGCDLPLRNGANVSAKRMAPSTRIAISKRNWGAL